MPSSLTCAEPFHVSTRFQLTLQSAIADLEAAAAQDERMLPLLENTDHRRRQQLLIDGQLDRAFRLHELLSRTASPVERRL
jgi:hypothetical protein